MRYYTDDVRPLPCGCSPSELRFFDEAGEELENVLEFEQVSGGARLFIKTVVGDVTITKEHFGQFQARCKHSRPYVNGDATGLDP